jgi:uncharacterized protein GlcG (DUF336 family)
MTAEMPSDQDTLPSAADTVILTLQDLLPDAGGEVVIHGAGVGAVGVSTDQAVTATGTADAHVTVAGEDVSGFRYYQLDSGITLYCPADTSLLLGPDIA